MIQELDEQPNGDEPETEDAETETENGDNPEIDTNVNDSAEASGELTGHHVFIDGEHNSGPYETVEDAQAFIDGQLDGCGTIRSF